MLCESLAYLLIEQETVSRQQVIDAIEGVIEVKQKLAGTSEPVVVSVASILLLGRVDGFNQHQSARKTDDG